ncbi:hypothetical protein W02_08490 [Nitrospira sp. KM1]|nr:hypothetical protein W02_08490 [Nitrospira sp. KM1]
MKTPSNFVLGRCNPSTYGKEYASEFSLPAALLHDVLIILFEWGKAFQRYGARASAQVACVSPSLGAGSLVAGGWVGSASWRGTGWGG